MGAQVAAQGSRPHLPVVAGVAGTAPAGAVGAIEVPVGDGGGIAHRALRGDGGPGFGPGLGAAGGVHRKGLLVFGT